VPLLSAFMEKGKHQDLIDYELLTAPAGDRGELKRVAAFGWYAGGESRVIGGFWTTRGFTYRSKRSERARR
jgi:hypothetical protein